jgi:hypothetical protein
MKITGLRMDEPEFFLENDEAIWLSRIHFDENVDTPIALIKKQSHEQGTVHGIARLKRPHRIQSAEDVFEQIPDDHYFRFRGIKKDIWAYPVETVMTFDEPQSIKDGLMSGQRNFIQNVEFARQTQNHLRNVSDGTIQKMHDRLHASADKNQLTEFDINVHYFLADEYEKRGMTHPSMDRLDHALDEMQAVDEKPCRMENESVEECVNRKIPVIKDEHPEWNHERAVAVAFNECSKECDEMSAEALIEHMGEWTIEDAKKWIGGATRQQYADMAQIANEAFHEFLERGRSVKYSFQLAISKAINDVTGGDHDE